MNKIIVKKDFTIGDEYFAIGDEVDLSEVKDYQTIVKLNEKGFIEPLTRKELKEIKKGLENPKKSFKEEEV